MTAFLHEVLALYIFELSLPQIDLFSKRSCLISFLFSSSERNLLIVWQSVGLFNVLHVWWAAQPVVSTDVGQLLWLCCWIWWAMWGLEEKRIQGQDGQPFNAPKAAWRTDVISPAQPCVFYFYPVLSSCQSPPGTSGALLCIWLCPKSPKSWWGAWCTTFFYLITEV